MNSDNEEWSEEELADWVEEAEQEIADGNTVSLEEAFKEE